MKKDKDFDCAPPKPKVDCRCCCPTCGLRYIENSNKLDPVKLNWKYCYKHLKNKFKDNEGFARKDCTSKNNVIVLSETDLLIIKEKQNKPVVEEDDVLGIEA